VGPVTANVNVCVFNCLCSCEIPELTSTYPSAQAVAGELSNPPFLRSWWTNVSQVNCLTAIASGTVFYYAGHGNPGEIYSEDPAWTVSSSDITADLSNAETNAGTPPINFAFLMACSTASTAEMAAALLYGSYVAGSALTTTLGLNESEVDSLLYDLQGDGGVANPIDHAEAGWVQPIHPILCSYYGPRLYYYLSQKYSVVSAVSQAFTDMLNYVDYWQKVVGGSIYIPGDADEWESWLAIYGDPFTTVQGIYTDGYWAGNGWYSVTCLD
jgi:hypothetical protein